MKYHFSLTLPSCGSCVSHSHCRECTEAAGSGLSGRIPAVAVCGDPSKKELLVSSPLDQEAIIDALDDMGIMAEQISP